MEWAKTPWFGICMLDMAGGLAIYFSPDTKLVVYGILAVINVAALGCWIYATFFDGGEHPNAEIKIDPQLDSHFLGLFLRGVICNKRKVIQNGRVRLKEVTSNRSERVQDMYLQWKGAEKTPQDIAPLTEKTFDLLLINKSRIEFIGYEGVNFDMKQRAGEGVFHFTLQLEGHNVTNKIEQKFSIEFPINRGDPIVKKE
jgi:hypothetical protein